LKALLLAAFLVLLSHQTHPLQASTNCQAISDKVKKTCSDLQWNCNNLKNCQEMRADCPHPKETVAGCSGLASCLEEKANKQQAGSFCDYDWSGQPNSGLCYLKNASKDSFSYQCPGYETFLDTYSDLYFNCEGHRQRAISDLSSCSSAVENFKAKCPNAQLPVIEESVKCNETRLSLNLPDSEISPVSSEDGPRKANRAVLKEGTSSLNSESQPSSSTR